MTHLAAAAASATPATPAAPATPGPLRLIHGYCGGRGEHGRGNNSVDIDGDNKGREEENGNTNIILGSCFFDNI